MKNLMFVLFAFTLMLSCNRKEEGQGYRENQEAATRPNDYTSGKDVKVVPDRPAERSPSERREKPEQSQ